MAMTVPEAPERHTETFSVYDVDGFADMLGKDVVFYAPGGAGRAVCLREARPVMPDTTAGPAAATGQDRSR
jgi:hypothetical protein